MFSRLILDIIGKAVFNCDFDSLSHDTGIVEVSIWVLYLFLFLFPWWPALNVLLNLATHLFQAVYVVLREAEERSVSVIPYWKIPIIKDIYPRQQEVAISLNLMSKILDDLIDNSKVL